MWLAGGGRGVLQGDTMTKPGGSSRRALRLASVSVLAVACVAFASEAWAEVDPETAERLRSIEARLAEQEQRLAEQERLIAAQQATLVEQQIALSGLQQAKEIMLGDLEEVRGTQGVANPNAAFQVAQATPAQPGVQTLPSGPVGEAPPPPQIQEQDVAALPERAGVLTPKGRFVLDPSFEYVRSSSNRLVFRGIEIVPGFQIGLIEANEAARDTIVHNLAARAGLTNRLEVDLRGSWVWREDRILTVQQRNETLTRERRLDGQDFGDLELGLRYQLNSGSRGRPIFVANTRLKAPTGNGPFDIEYNEVGVAQELATGSGFWGLEAGVTMLYATDPGVIFGGLSYIYNRPDDVNKIIGQARVFEVDPGDGLNLNMGYGLSLNPRFSVSFGYTHTYIFPTRTFIGPVTPVSGEPAGVDARSPEIHVGSYLVGWSFRLTPRVTVSNNFEFGATEAAPDMRWVIRVPYRF